MITNTIQVVHIHYQRKHMNFVSVSPGVLALVVESCPAPCTAHVAICIFKHKACIRYDVQTPEESTCLHAKSGVTANRTCSLKGLVTKAFACESFIVELMTAGSGHEAICTCKQLDDVDPQLCGMCITMLPALLKLETTCHYHTDELQNSWLRLERTLLPEVIQSQRTQLLLKLEAYSPCLCFAMNILYSC